MAQQFIDWSHVGSAVFSIRPHNDDGANGWSCRRRHTKQLFAPQVVLSANCPNHTSWGRPTPTNSEGNKGGNEHLLIPPSNNGAWTTHEEGPQNGALFDYDVNHAYNIPEFFHVIMSPGRQYGNEIMWCYSLAYADRMHAARAAVITVIIEFARFSSPACPATRAEHWSLHMLRRRRPSQGDGYSRWSRYSV